jgi:hypothetical protein
MVPSSSEMPVATTATSIVLATQVRKFVSWSRLM